MPAMIPCTATVAVADLEHLEARLLAWGCVVAAPSSLPGGLRRVAFSLPDDLFRRLLAAASTLTPPVPPTPPAPPPVPDAAAAMLALHNAVRAGRGLAPLALDARLAAAAQAQADWLASPAGPGPDAPRLRSIRGGTSGSSRPATRRRPSPRTRTTPRPGPPRPWPPGLPRPSTTPPWSTRSSRPSASATPPIPRAWPTTWRTSPRPPPTRPCADPHLDPGAGFPLGSSGPGTPPEPGLPP